MTGSYYYDGVFGSSWYSAFGSTTTSPHSYPDSGISSLTISNSAGDRITPNAFQMGRTRVSGSVIDGLQQYDPYQKFGSTNWPTSLYLHRYSTYANSVPGGLENRMIAATNPDRPEVLLPTFVYELRDIPGMIRHAGRLLKKIRRPSGLSPDKEAAAAWVAYNFGFAPLVSDLQKLVSFSDLAAKREKEFDRLYSGSGLKRRLTLYSTSSEVSTPFTAPGYGSMAVSGQCVTTVWGSIRYKPVGTSTGSPLARPAPSYVKRAVLGLNAANVAANVWEALPWSWFIDYFLGVQDFLGTSPLGRSAEYSGCCIMTRHEATLKHSQRQRTDQYKNTETLSGGTLSHESKARRVAYPTGPIPRMPHFSGRQLSILGSLAILRSRP